MLEIPRGCYREGTARVIPRLKEIRLNWRPAAVARPPAADLIDEATRAGIEVTQAGSADEAAAFALMVAGIRDKTVAHLGREHAPTMWQAIALAETKDIGDGGKDWSRRESESDITPITSATLAYWALNKKRRNYDVLKSIA